jgi:hypothetical protein
MTVNEEMAASEYADNVTSKSKYSVRRRIVLGHVRYGTFGKIVSRVFILLRQNNWMHRNLIAGNFNMTNVKGTFKVW